MRYLALVSFIWAFSFGLIGSALKGVDSYFVATVRLSLALLVFLPFLRFGQIARRDVLQLPLYGAIQFGLMYVAYIKAFQYIPSHLVALFSVLTPVYVVLIHDMRQRRFTPRYLGAAALSVLGAAIIRAKGEDQGSVWIGFVLMQVAGLAFAFGQVAYRDWKRTRPEVSDHAVFALLYAGGAALALAFSASFTDWSALSLTTNHWQSLAYLGVVASGLGFFFWNKGAALCNPGVLAAFNNVVVPLGVICSLFLFGEIKDADSASLVRLALGAVCIGAAVRIGQRPTK